MHKYNQNLPIQCVKKKTWFYGSNYGAQKNTNKKIKGPFTEIP